MKHNPALSGNILPTVLVVGTVMLLAVMAMLYLLDAGSWLVYGHHSRRQKLAWAESALVLYQRDSTLMHRLDEHRGFLLFEDDPASVITLSHRWWGLYEVVGASMEEGKYKRTQLMGYRSESPADAALYVPDNQRAFTLAGNTQVIGPVHLPQSGILYGQVQSDFYSGRPIPAGEIRSSAPRLPGPAPGVIDSLKNLYRNAAQAIPLSDSERRNSHSEPTRWLQTARLSGVVLRGNIGIFSEQEMEIDSACRLEDVILIAPKVYVRKGFSGSLQILAADSVVIEPDVRLKYPSGIVIPEAAAYSYIEIGENSEVNGYVVLQTATDIPPEKRTPHYLQLPDSRVRGLVWIDGIAQVNGTVTGSLYAAELNYYTAQGYYTNLLYNASVYRAEAMAFPLWMTGKYQRKGIKWVD